eukprot:2359326-Heterocapsa_arctica.AAC.1
MSEQPGAWQSEHAYLYVLVMFHEDNLIMRSPYLHEQTQSLHVQGSMAWPQELLEVYIALAAKSGWNHNCHHRR